MITFKSVGHFFAKVYQDVVAELPKIEATKTTVEAVTAVVDPVAVPVEDAAYAVLGEVSAALTAGGTAAEAKLADAGLDVNVINTVKSVLASIPQFVALAKKL
jgi:hypothetical protein